MTSTTIGDLVDLVDPFDIVDLFPITRSSLFCQKVKKLGRLIFFCHIYLPIKN